MLSRYRKLDPFTRNIIFVFIGGSLGNFLNLLYQLLIAHSLSAIDFAAFNSLLAIFMLISTPIGTIQLAIAKYLSVYRAKAQDNKVTFLVSDLIKKASILGILTLIIFLALAAFIVGSLKIDSLSCGYILALLLASACLGPVLGGSMQGLELFGWMVSASLLSGIIKLGLTALLLFLGFKIAGALGAFLIANLIVIIIGWLAVRKNIDFSETKKEFNYKEMLLYLFPIAISNMCFIWLVSFDMVLVKYFFSANESGAYSLAQMLGKIFLFLPGAISLVMFPRTSGLNAVSQDTRSVLRKSLFYAFCLCLLATLVYNVVPSFALRILTGKALPESIFLGRLFSISMSFFALTFVLINYFLSIKDFRFIKFLVLSVILQFSAILLFHHNLIEIQIILCINSILTFALGYYLAFYKRKR